MNTNYCKKSVWAFFLVIVPITIYVIGVILTSRLPLGFIQNGGIYGVIGAVGFIIAFVGIWLLPFFLIIGFILGILSLREIKVSPELKGKGLSIVAIIISIPVIILSILMALSLLRAGW